MIGSEYASTFAAMGVELAKAASLALIYADDDDGPAEARHYERLIASSAPVPDAMATREDLAGIFYTGGTTGRSKGVMLSHGNLMVNSLHSLGEGLFQSSATYLHAAPMFHLANGAEMYSLLLSGGSNEGLLGVNFRVTGSLSQPEIYVNPLSAIAPGILRRIFDIGSPGQRDFEPNSQRALDRARGDR